MNLSLDTLKYKNLKLLLGFFFVMQLCFHLVVKKLEVFRKIGEKLELTYSIDYTNYVITLMVVIACCLILTLEKLKDFSYCVGALFLIFSVFPGAILFAYVEPYDIRIFISHILLFLVVVYFTKIPIAFPIQVFSTKNSTKLLLIISAVGVLPFVIFYLPHVNLKNLLLLEVYETRARMNKVVSYSFLNYTYSWLNKVVIPALLVFSWYYRKKTIFVFSVLSLVFLFLCGANKIVFGGLIMVILLYSFEYKKKINFLLKFLILVSFSSLAASLMFQNDALMELTVRRNFMLPALLDIIYFDFFDDNHLYWSTIVNGLVIDYPYAQFHTYILGKEYFGSITWSANNGVISDGFANLGMIGNFINILVIGLYFSILARLNISPKFFGIVFLMVISMYNSALPTILLTHGGFVFLIIAILTLRNTGNKM